MRRTAVLVAGWSVCAALAAAAAQTSPQAPSTPAQQNRSVFTGRADLVQLDVSVIDKNHQPVRGLTVDDFIVKEDGKPQKVVALHAVDMDEPPPPPVAWMRDVTPDVTTNALDESARITVIVIDDALIPMDPFMIKNAKAIVTKIIDKLGPRDRTAVVFSADNRKSQDFTNDHATLLATLDKFHPGWACWGAPGCYDSLYRGMSLRTLKETAESLMAVPGRRKTLLWVTPGIPVDIAVSAPQAISATGSMADREEMAQLTNGTTGVFERAQSGNVAIYPIDPTGLGGLEEFIFGELFMDPEKRKRPVETRAVAHKQATLAYEFLATTALNSGGHVISRTNDPLPGVDQVFQETSSYYMLGFQPLNMKEDGTLRRLDVKVNRPGVEVYARNGYYVPKPIDRAAAAKAATENAVLARAIGGLLPSADLPLGVTVAPFALPGQHTAAVAIALGVRQPVPDEAAKAKITETTELQISAFTPEGAPRGTQRSTAHVTLRLGATGDAEYEVLGRIDLAPGRYALRLAAHNAASAKTGGVEANVIIPDFTNDAFSISGVVVGRTPATPSAPRPLLAALLPIVPTAVRAFSMADRADVYFQLYQSGKKPIGAVKVAIRIANDHGGTDVSETQTIVVDKFTAAPLPPSRAPSPSSTSKPDPFANAWLRAADVRYAIPLAKLGPGEHLLTFEATLGATTLRRDVRFSVK